MTGDMSAYVLAFPDNTNSAYHLLAHFWAPEDGKWKKEPKNLDRYKAWERDGYLTLTPGNTTDHQQIEDDIVAWARSIRFAPCSPTERMPPSS